MSLGPIGTALIIPPTNLLLASIAGMMIARRRPRIGLALVSIGLIGMLLLALPIVADNLIGSLEIGLPISAAGEPPPGAIVILGADVTRVAGEIPQTEIGYLTLERIRAGAALYRRVRLPILVTGGTPRDGDLPVATLMARSLAQDFHLPARWTETRSKDTWENARDSAAILTAAGIHSVYLVTHAWHMRRAMIAFRHFGIPVIAAPVRLDATGPVTLGQFFPGVSSWVASYLALHEWIGCAYYALRG